MPLPARPFGRLPRAVPPIGFGAWAIGGTWGDVPEDQAKAALNAALDAGVDFIDTADVYGDGRSEKIIASVLKARPGPRPFVATKVGRRISPFSPEAYTKAALSDHIDRCRSNLGQDRLDLVQIHCPPHAVFADFRVFDILSEIAAEGRMQAWGASVERIDEGLASIAHPGCASVQIIWNLFRQRPAEVFFPAARAAGVAVIARVPLASGLLTGKMSASSTFAADDHRSFNREGAAFDKGETFSGVPFDVALAVVEELRALVPQGASMAAWALRWCLMEEAVTVVIPGAKTADQARANLAAGDLPALSGEVMQAARAVYHARIAPHVHGLW